MIVYNDLTLFAAAVGLSLGFGAYSFSRSASVSFFIGIVSIIGFDLIARMQSRNEEVPLLSPQAGGHMWFIPNWILGIVAAGIGGLLWSGWL